MEWKQALVLHCRLLHPPPSPPLRVTPRGLLEDKENPGPGRPDKASGPGRAQGYLRGQRCDRSAGQRHLPELKEDLREV